MRARERRVSRIELAPMPRLEKLADGVYAHVQPDGGWVLSNGGFLPGGNGGIVIDTAGTERRNRSLIEQMAAIDPHPVRLIINTHHHGDHTYGNAMFDQAEILAHRTCRDEIITAGLSMQNMFPTVEWGHVEVRPPTMVFDGQQTIWHDGIELQLLHLGPAHTRGDIVVWLPEQRILFTGDLVMGRVTPFSGMGTGRGLMETLGKLQDLEPRIVVPGHGAVGGPELLQDQIDYLHWLLKIAREGRADALEPLELARKVDLGAYAEWPCSERLVANLHRAYFEVADEPLPPVDRARAFKEMAILAGVPALVSHA